MCKRLQTLLPALLALTIGASMLSAQTRPPAVPLVAHDPYFSIWSITDKLTDSNTRHWTGTEQPMAGLVRIDGASYRIMGAEPREVPALPQSAVKVTPTHTIYTFSGAGVEVKLTFFTPAFVQDLDLLSRPVTYLRWDVKSVDSAGHEVAVCLDVDPRIAVNSDDQEVVWGRSHTRALTVLNVGSRDQKVLNRSGDNLRIDWGFFHLAVPADEHSTMVASDAALTDFAKTGKLPADDDMEMPKQPRAGGAHLAVAFDLGKVGSQSVSRHALLSYTEEYAIELMNRKLRPYWQRNGQQVQAMLADAESQYLSLIHI